MEYEGEGKWGGGGERGLFLKAIVPSLSEFGWVGPWFQTIT